MLVIFDLDGTILDTLGDLLGAMNATLAHFGYPGHTLAEMRTFIGNGLRMMAVRALPEGTDDGTVEKVYKYFKSYYSEHLNIETKPYEGIRELLSSLKAAGIDTAVSTNKFDYGAKVLIKEHFGDLIGYTLGETEGTPRKPDPAGPRKIMEHFGATEAETVYIGDSGVDVQTAENLGVKGIAVTWGFQDEDRLLASGAKTVVRSVQQLKSLLLPSES